ncbi:MAG: hypothetical protein ABUL58_01095 [Steroidobacter sp.]
MNIDELTVEELRAEVNRILNSLSQRERDALAALFRIKAVSQSPDQEDVTLRAMLRELVAMKGSKK